MFMNLCLKTVMHFYRVLFAGFFTIYCSVFEREYMTRFFLNFDNNYISVIIFYFVYKKIEVNKFKMLRHLNHPYILLKVKK